MGDFIQFTTRPNHSSVYYKFTSQAFNFEIKGLENARIALSERSGGADFSIVLGHNRISYIKSHSEGSSGAQTQTIETPNILSEQDYRQFWISWYGNQIHFGNEGETKPLVEMVCKDTSKLSYVAFTSLDGNSRNALEWIVEMPPQLDKPPRKLVTGGELYWVRMGADRKLPDNACIAGFENEPLFIIRAEHQGSLTPGKYVPSKRLGYIGWSWQAHPKESFEVLCGYDYTWVPCKHDIPADAVVGGYSENSLREKLYVGRAKHLGHIIPGKIQTSHGTCFMAYDGKEISTRDYEIMVVPDKVRCVSKYLVKSINYNNVVDYDEDDNNYYESESDED